MPKIRLASARKLLTVTIGISVIFAVGYGFGLMGFSASIRQFPKVTISREIPPDKNLDFSLFWEVWDKVSTTYYDKSKVIPSEMVYGAIKGMVASLGDPYTAFFTPTENKMVNDDLSGSFEGVGIEIGYRDSKLVVISPLAGTPAEQAGIKAGDEILEIKDARRNISRSTLGMSLADAVGIIRGPRGTKVTLVIHREGTDGTITKDIERSAIKVSSVTLTYKGKGDIAYVKVSKFGNDTFAEWKKTADTLAARKDLKGVIIDLRNNPGGYLDGATNLAGYFVKAGTKLVIEEGVDGKQQFESASSDGELLGIQTIVLINKGSASASEIFAGALRDSGRAKLVGETSFGKGTVQEPDNLTNGSGLHVTISKWLTPSGFWVNEKGLEPDIKVVDDIKTDADEQLDKAVELLAK